MSSLIFVKKNFKKREKNNGYSNNLKMNSTREDFNL